MDDNKIKHLEFIQNIITRMNSNSFQLKGMVITIVSALLAVYASNKNQDFILIAIVPSILFWFLDAYYLQQERKFRGMYNDVSGVNENPKEFKPFEMRPDKYIGDKYLYIRVFFSPTIWPIYTVLVFGLLLTYKLINCTNG
ncbi:hypothetical protein F7644_12145 [Tenacibaculum finnmarkense genomovar ulcerans]|uniref:hypothetical protein n=1 Tax=Tenacibaculum finnmarkense TaxID=2781243 RepID=UPI00187B9BC5|nr:hypothetical protein [Tenacibaculum finnmarkense]MBE7646730.1 hypothetical protein [Tenacibaculum finnmarkense genomovar ulcerans]